MNLTVGRAFVQNAGADKTLVLLVLSGPVPPSLLDGGMHNLDVVDDGGGLTLTVRRAEPRPDLFGWLAEDILTQAMFGPLEGPGARP